MNQKLKMMFKTIRAPDDAIDCSPSAKEGDCPPTDVIQRIFYNGDRGLPEPLTVNIPGPIKWETVGPPEPPPIFEKSLDNNAEFLSFVLSGISALMLLGSVILFAYILYLRNFKGADR